MSMQPLVHAAVLLVFGALLLTAAAGDLRRLTVSNGLCLAIATLYPAHVLSAPVAVDWIGALAVAGLSLAAGLAAFPRYAGGGDVKLFTAAALWAGPALFAPFLLVTALAGLVMALAALGRRWYAGRALATSAGVAGARSADPSAPAASQVLPYAVAIAAGGLTVAAMLFTGG